uniref:Malate dehydrogenase n=1 Tax=uncultured bacterium contig00115 TaxID=1181577 RepID=A0A806KST7_9BACT|nr:malate dehydrogenase [uncultured bacterium contig00115]
MNKQIDTQKVFSFCERLFQAYGFSANESKIITDVLIRADLYGIESHGIHRLVRYHEEITSGQVTVGAKTQIIHETAISAAVDANKAMGQLVSVEGMKLAMEKARNSGCGMVTVRNSNHYGIASYYTELAAREDLIGVCMTNTEAICVPTFGSQAMTGTNALALAMPADPFVFSYDASTTVVPRGKLEVYRKNGEPLPHNWALDQDGKPCTDAALVVDNIIKKAGGGIAPLGGLGTLHGGHKGYGLSVIVDLFSAVISGGLTSNYVNRKPDHTGICHYFMAIDYGIFGDKKAIKENMSKFLQEIRDSKKAHGHNRIYTHGEKETEMMAERLNGTIPVNEKTLEEMQKIATGLGVDYSL